METKISGFSRIGTTSFSANSLENEAPLLLRGAITVTDSVTENSATISLTYRPVPTEKTSSSATASLQASEVFHPLPREQQLIVGFHVAEALDKIEFPSPKKGTICKSPLIPADRFLYDDGGVLEREFTDSPDTEGAPLQISFLHSGEEKVWTPSPSPKIALEKDHLAPNEPHLILCYGFEPNRTAMEDSFSHFIKLENNTVFSRIDEYNTYLDLFPNELGFPELLKILPKIKSATLALNNASLANGSERFYKTSLYRGLDERKDEADYQARLDKNTKTAMQWNSYLSEHVAQLIPTRKTTPEKWVPFIIKNIKPALVYKSSEFHRYFDLPMEGENLENFQKAIAPLLHILSHLESADKASLLKSYDSLTDDQKELLNLVCSVFFFRQTSKLGLSFAKTIGATILFDWNSKNATLEQLHQQLDARPSKQNPPQLQFSFRGNKIAEPTTYSEMRQLGRITERGEAPHYLLVKEYPNPEEIV